jgi:GT2 family glycosyltransferase
LHNTRPPAPGWTGKNNALHTAAEDAPGEWMLFVDSDVVLEKDALSAAMAVVLRKKFDLLSLLPRLESHTLWESVVVPLAGAAASSLYLIALTNNSQVTSNAFANGQFMLINRSSYDAIGGHVTVRDRFCEDVEIARLLKTQGFRPRVSWGNDFAAVRMYSSLSGIISGWARIFYSARVGSPWTILMGILFLVFCCFTAYAALAWGIYRAFHPSELIFHINSSFAWLGASLNHLMLMFWLLGVVYAWSGNSRRNAFLFPIGGTLLMVIFLRALRMCITKKVEWRGTAYSHVMAADLTSRSSVSAPTPAEGANQR